MKCTSGRAGARRSCYDRYGYRAHSNGRVPQVASSSVVDASNITARRFASSCHGGDRLIPASCANAGNATSSPATSLPVGSHHRLSALSICSASRLASASQQIEACGMSANKSQRQLATNALASMVAAYPEWQLVVTCRNCCACRRRVSDCGNCPARTVPMATMPGRVTVSALLGRLRCRDCRARPDRVWLHLPDPVEWRRRTLLIRGRGNTA